MLKIKKKFTLNTNDMDVIKLNKLTTELQVNAMLLDSVKKDLSNILIARNGVIKNLLLHKYEYILSPTDQVVYHDQIGEILIYEGNAGSAPAPLHEE